MEHQIRPTSSKGIERLAVLRKLGIPGDWTLRVHQNRLLQTAREGANTDAAHLRDFGDERRHATLMAVVLDTMAMLTDETLEMHERTIGREFKKASGGTSTPSSRVAKRSTRRCDST